MSFLFPGFLAAAGAIAAATTLLHFIVTREPDLYRLPTARFAPERAIQSRARALEPSDLLLLALRVALVLAVGAALARPIVSPPRRDVVRIVLLDRSRGVASAGEAADSARAVLGERDLLVVFDSGATWIERGIADTLARLSRSGAEGRLSSGLIAALRTASRIRDEADSLELVVVSPLLGGEIDAATDSVRALWPAAIRFVPVEARPDSGLTPPALEGAPDDPLRLALPLGSAGVPSVRIVRRLATAADSAWAAVGGRVLVAWPAGGEAPDHWRRHDPDTVGAVVAGSVVVVAPFARRLSWREGGAADAAPAPDRVIARWVDGAPAATEASRGDGCIRTITIDVPAVGDLVLEPRFARLVASLTGPCGRESASGPLSSAAVRSLSGSFLSGRAPSSGFPAPDRAPSRWAGWLLVAAALLAAGEMVLRRRIAR